MRRTNAHELCASAPKGGASGPVGRLASNPALPPAAWTPSAVARLEVLASEHVTTDRQAPAPQRKRGAVTAAVGQSLWRKMRARTAVQKAAATGLNAAREALESNRAEVCPTSAPDRVGCATAAW